MKFSFIKSLCVFAIFSLFTVNVFADTYTVDPSHSSVNWKINHLGFSNYEGKWFVKGTLDFDQSAPEKSKVNVTVDMKSLVTGDAELNKHLGSADFFDFAKYPTATFVSDKVEVTGKNTGKIYGTLTLHGVSKPVVLDVTMNNLGENPVSKKQTVGFSATTTLKRSDFGINAYIPAVSDDVTMDIELEAYKP